MRIEVLDHGHVTYVDHMGSDQRVVDCARASIQGENVKATNSNRNLIRYLVNHKHTTPLESVVFTFQVKCPIFVARQWLRHRTLSANELSARYGELPQEMYQPEVLHEQSKDNKQGSGTEITGNKGKNLLSMMQFSNESVYRRYQILLQNGVAREEARMVLPVGIYTQFYITQNLHNLFHFLTLRSHPHAQYEIRVYADAIASIVKEKVPLCWEAYEDYILHAKQFSRMELAALRSLLAQSGLSEFEAKQFGMSKREQQEFLNKLGAR